MSPLKRADRENHQIELLDGENSIDFVLREEGESKYLDACAPLMRDVAIHTLDMGFRPDEIYRLEWPQIHDNSITIYKGKTDRARRTVATTERVIDVLTKRGLFDHSLRESH